MRRNIVSVGLSAIVSTVLAVSVLGGVPAGAQTTPPPAGACTGDLVTATINASSLPTGGWSVTDACVSARDFFTGSYEDRIPFALGISVVTYDDGHTGRLAFLSLQLSADTSLTVIGMEDPATNSFRFAGSAERATVSTSGATVGGQGISFPPLEPATVRLDFRDVAAPWPDWATTTTTVPVDPASPVPTTVPATEPAPATTTVPPTTVPVTVPTTTPVPPADGGPVLP